LQRFVAGTLRTILVANFDRMGIAKRLRELVGGPNSSLLVETAVRLGVEELSLRMSIDEDSPHPTVEVLAAVIREYGVDPTWLLTGNYDAATHRSAMERTTITPASVEALLGTVSPLVAELPPEQMHHSEN
jgi:hypothetical protein